MRRKWSFLNLLTVILIPFIQKSWTMVTSPSQYQELGILDIPSSSDKQFKPKCLEIFNLLVKFFVKGFRQ